MARSKRTGEPGTLARNKFTGEVIGKFDKNGAFISTERIESLNRDKATRESRLKGIRKGHITMIQNGTHAEKTAKALLACASQQAQARRDFKKMARDVLDKIIDGCGDDVVEGAKQIAKLAKGDGASSALEQISAFKAISDIVLSDLRKSAHVGSTHTTNNILVASEDKTSRFLSAFADRGRELVTVSSGPETGPSGVPIGLPDGRVQRDDDSQGPGEADGVAESDHHGGGEQPRDDGGTDGPPG